MYQFCYFSGTGTFINMFKMKIFLCEGIRTARSADYERYCSRIDWQVDASLDWIYVEKIKIEMAKSMFKTQLHDGEVEVMILAKEKNADTVIIDDANAKK